MRQRLRSFGYALRGLLVMLREQPHAQFHLLATLLVLCLGLWLHLRREEWLALLLTIGLVWVAEGMNTALEYLCDAVHPEHHPLVGKAKDVAAGAVLASAAVALAIGWLVFGPYFSRLSG